MVVQVLLHTPIMQQMVVVEVEQGHETVRLERHYNLVLQQEVLDMMVAHVAHHLGLEEVEVVQVQLDHLHQQIPEEQEELEDNIA
jgi:hypothetical protein